MSRLDGAALKTAKSSDDVLSDIDLHVEHLQNVSVCDWENVFKNYLRGFFNLHIALHADDSGNNMLTLTVRRDVVHHHGPMVDGVGRERAFVGGELKLELFVESSAELDETRPMLCRVGDLVDTPKGIIPSRVWLECQDGLPLVVGKLLFYLFFVSRRWKRSRVSTFVEPTEWKADAGGPISVVVDNLSNHFVEGGSQVPNSFNNTKGNLVRQRLANIGDYVNQMRISIQPDRNALFSVPSDAAFNFLDFGFRVTYDPVRYGEVS